MNNELPLLITIGPSHYCDKVRWALDYLNIKYKEDPHPPLLHFSATYKYKTRTVPILITGDGIFKDSTDILQYLNKNAPENSKLYPKDNKLRKEVEELEELFDTKLGPHARRWAYYYLLEAPELVFEIFNEGAHPFEESMFETFFPVIKQLMKKGMNITARTTERSRNIIVEIFETVEKKLADGRNYLTGNTLTAADITFASLAAPVVFPKGYIKEKKVISEYVMGQDDEIMPEAAPVNEFKDFPEIMVDEIKEFRKMKAGIFARELYEKERFKKVTKE